jgi:hypothetical protein
VAASADPAFGDRVHAGRPDVASTLRMPASARTASNAAVKFEPRSRGYRDSSDMRRVLEIWAGCELAGEVDSWCPRVVFRG